MQAQVLRLQSRVKHATSQHKKHDAKVKDLYQSLNQYQLALETIRNEQHDHSEHHVTELAKMQEQIKLVHDRLDQQVQQVQGQVQKVKDQVHGEVQQVKDQVHGQVQLVKDQVLLRQLGSNESTVAGGAFEELAKQRQLQEQKIHDFSTRLQDNYQQDHAKLAQLSGKLDALVNDQSRHQQDLDHVKETTTGKLDALVNDQSRHQQDLNHVKETTTGKLAQLSGKLDALVNDQSRRQQDLDHVKETTSGKLNALETGQSRHQQDLNHVKETTTGKLNQLYEQLDALERKSQRFAHADKRFSTTNMKMYDMNQQLTELVTKVDALQTETKTDLLDQIDNSVKSIESIQDILQSSEAPMPDTVSSSKVDLLEQRLNDLDQLVRKPTDYVTLDMLMSQLASHRSDDEDPKLPQRTFNAFVAQLQDNLQTLETQIPPKFDETKLATMQEQVDKFHQNLKTLVLEVHSTKRNGDHVQLLEAKYQHVSKQLTQNQKELKKFKKVKKDLEAKLNGLTGARLEHLNALPSLASRLDTLETHHSIQDTQNHAVTSRITALETDQRYGSMARRLDQLETQLAQQPAFDDSVLPRLARLETLLTDRVDAERSLTQRLTTVEMSRDKITILERAVSELRHDSTASTVKTTMELAKQHADEAKASAHKAKQTASVCAVHARAAEKISQEIREMTDALA